MFIELFNSLLKLLPSVKWLKSQIYKLLRHCKSISVGRNWVLSCFWALHLQSNTLFYILKRNLKLTQTHSCRVRCVILKEHYFCKDSKNIFPCGTSIISPGRVNLNTVLPVIGTWKLEEYVTLQICWRDAFPLYIISVSNQLCCRSGLEQLCEMTRRRAGGPRNIPAVIREKI